MAGGPNPFRGADPSVILLGDFQVPGHVVRITGAKRAFEWTVQKATDKSGASTVYKGTKLTEGIKVVIEAKNEADFDALYELRDTTCPLPGQKPPTFAVDNLIINFNKIVRVSLGEIDQPTWDEKSGKYTLEFELIEYAPPSKTAAGPADKPKPGDDGNDASAPSINAAAAKQGKVVMGKADTA